MKILVIGSGGREHALCHSLQQSALVSELHAVPGSAGIGQIALCHDIDWHNTDSVVQLCLKSEINLVIIGPEDPLVFGLSDQLRDRGILVVGPSKEAAQLEGSKIFAKEFMRSAGVPTADYVTVTSVKEVMQSSSRFTPPYVLKADGLAAGKGVFICKDLTELENAAIDLFENKVLGNAGRQALLEQFYSGWELSYLILTNGSSWQALPLAQDHKRLQDQDQGPNTGGMGTIAPLKIADSLRHIIETEVINKTVAHLKNMNLVYRGILFIGIIVTENGPIVLEYNCRLGDPETQVILPLIDNDLAQVFQSLAKGQLETIKTKNRFATCVVLAAPGYPKNPEKNIPIEGDLSQSTSMSYFLHAGTKKDSTGQWLTSGGRVLNAIGLGSTCEEARTNAYNQAENARWMGLQKRKDIGILLK
jgi:phosphoribosylamine--glycine ligase